MLCLEQPSIRVNRTRLATRFSIRFKANLWKPSFTLPLLPLGLLESPNKGRAAFPGYRKLYSFPSAHLGVLSDGFELSAFRHQVHLHVTPERNQELTRQCHNFNLTPAKKFHCVQPSAVEPDAPKSHELFYLLDTLLLRAPYSLFSLSQKLFDLQPNDLQPVVFVRHVLYYSLAERRAVPEPGVSKPCHKPLPTACQQNALGSQQPLDSIDLARPFRFQTHQLSVKLPAILFLHARRMHDAPNLLLAPAIANQHRQKLSHIQMISFRAACPTIDFNARRIHHVIVHPDVQQKPVKPKAIRPSLVAAHHLRRPGQPKALLSSLNLLPEPLSVSSSNCDLARLLPHTNGRPDLPFRFSQFERNVENLLLNCDSLSFAGRCCFHLTPPLLWFVVLRSLTASARFFHSISPSAMLPFT